MKQHILTHEIIAAVSGDDREVLKAISWKCYKEHDRIRGSLPDNADFDFTVVNPAELTFSYFFIEESQLWGTAIYGQNKQTPMVQKLIRAANLENGKHYFRMVKAIFSDPVKLAASAEEILKDWVTDITLGYYQSRVSYLKTMRDQRNHDEV